MAAGPDAVEAIFEIDGAEVIGAIEGAVGVDAELDRGGTVAVGAVDAIGGCWGVAGADFGGTGGGVDEIDDKEAGEVEDDAAVTRCQSVYTREMAKSAHLSASAAEQRSDATDRAGNPADEVREDLSAIKMIGPSTRNRKVTI